ncbi:MAG: hypothetical protein NVSMB23_08580 [Myxococcales bacterium]
MKVSRIEWDARNLAHFAFHRERGISEEDVADILLQRCHPHRSAAILRHPQSEPRRAITGRSCTGKYLLVVIAPGEREIVRPITAWPLNERETTRYLAWRRTVKR